jgi:hypothetical protein
VKANVTLDLDQVRDFLARALYDTTGHNIGEAESRGMAEPSPDTTLVEAVKLFGGIAGLLTAAFMVWGRWARGRPLAWVTAAKFGANPLEYIRLKNPGYGDVFVLGLRAYPRIYDVAKDREARVCSMI